MTVESRWRWKSILIGAYICAVLSISVANGAELKVMTFNILHGGTALGQPLTKTVEAIETSGADLIGLQEQSGSTAALADMLGFYHHVQDGDISVLSRYPITQTLSSGVEVALPSGEPAYLFNVHLAAYPYQPYDIRDGLISTEVQVIAAAQAARGAAMSRTLETMSPYLTNGAPVFLVGDFNEPSHLDWTAEAADAGMNFGMKVAWPASIKAEQAGLTDSYRAVHSNPVERRGDTWTPLDGPDEVHDRIDIVYHAGELVDPIDAIVVGENDALADLVVTPYPSDHRAVVGRFALAASGGLTVRVDRQHGQVVVQNTSAEVVHFDGYSLTSPGGHLAFEDNGWRSLADQGFADWQEANPNASRLSELNPLGTMTLAPSETFTLGKAYHFLPGALGEAYVQDLRFRYFDPSEQTLSAAVEFHGWRNDVVLVIDPESGAAILENQSSLEVPIDGYRISSKNGSLNPQDGAWSSFADRDLDSWMEANPSEKMLAELNPLAANVLGPGARIRLGILFDPLAKRDLALEFLMADDSLMRPGLVVYEPFTECPAGDANGDCRVTVADLNAVRNSFGASGIGLTGDVDWDGRINIADLNAVRNNFGEAGPLAVPEPAAWVLMALGISCCATRSLLCHGLRTVTVFQP
ncbi:MAG: endonuclease/exonuclease/phosphatase family protein [Planctomycetia bacterium]|nr:endonuclease/exonuclease/phosphatase family protein [Planctomycetia bacterium]